MSSHVDAHSFFLSMSACYGSALAMWPFTSTHRCSSVFTYPGSRRAYFTDLLWALSIPGIILTSVVWASKKVFMVRETHSILYCMRNDMGTLVAGAPQERVASAYTPSSFQRVPTPSMMF